METEEQIEVRHELMLALADYYYLIKYAESISTRLKNICDIIGSELDAQGEKKE